MLLSLAHCIPRGCSCTSSKVLQTTSMCVENELKSWRDCVFSVASPQNMNVGEIFFNQEENCLKFEVRRDKICVVHRRKAVCVMDLSTFAAPCVQSSISCLQSDRTSTSLRVIILTNNIKTLNASPICTLTKRVANWSFSLSSNFPSSRQCTDT